MKENSNPPALRSSLSWAGAVFLGMPSHGAGCAPGMICLGQRALTPKPVILPPGAPGACPRIAACSLPWLRCQHSGTWPGPAGPLLSPYGSEHPSPELEGRVPGCWNTLGMAGGLGGLASGAAGRSCAWGGPRGALGGTSCPQRSVSAQGMPAAQALLGLRCGPGSRKPDLHMGRSWEKGSSTGLLRAWAHHGRGPQGNQPAVPQHRPSEALGWRRPTACWERDPPKSLKR